MPENPDLWLKTYATRKFWPHKVLPWRKGYIFKGNCACCGSGSASVICHNAMTVPEVIILLP